VQDVIERIYWEHRQGLYTLALAITRRPDRAEDAVQDAFARLWGSKARPDGDLVPYVFAAVRNAAIDQIRRRDPAVTGADSVSIYNGLPAEPEDRVVTAEEHRRLRQALDDLPETQRETVVMKVYGGLTFEQMSRALGEPLQTTASRYRRAIERLGRMLRGGEEVSHA